MEAVAFSDNFFVIHRYAKGDDEKVYNDDENLYSYM